MAILALPPLIRPRFAGKRALKKVEGIDEVQISIGSQKLDTRKFMLLMASAVTINLLVIAGINILMTQDAFTLQELKSQRNTALDEKDAILNLVNEKNSPVNLSKAAIELGMKPANKIGYLTYSEAESVVVR
jgi:copper chaperone CopZ